MTLQLTKLLTTELSYIEKKLFECKIETEEFIFWDTKFRDDDSRLTSNINASIYNGVSGICIFYLELFEVKKYKKSDEFLKKIGNWLVKHHDQGCKYNYSFYSGQLGVAYTLSLLANQTKDVHFLNTALKIAKGAEEVLYSNNPLCELIHGLSGTLVGLTLVYDQTKEETLVSLIEKLVIKLLSQTKLSENGFYWDLDKQHNAPLCGLSHGISGITYALSFVGNYFNNNDLIEFSFHSMLYETKVFDNETKMWPDFRVNYIGKDSDSFLSQCITDEQYSIFSKKTFFNAWCHGAGGIGLVRLHLLKIKQTDQLLKDVDNAVTVTQNSLTAEGLPSATLCHGALGNAFLLSAFSKVNTKKSNLSNTIAKTIRNTIGKRQKETFYKSGFDTIEKYEDCTLFLGISGIGYYYISCLYGLKNANLILPHLQNTSTIRLKVSKEIIDKCISISLLFKLYPKVTPTYDYSMFLNQLSIQKNDILFYDLIKILNEKNSSSSAKNYYTAKNIVASNAIKLTENLAGLTFKLAPHVSFYINNRTNRYFMISIVSKRYDFIEISENFYMILLEFKKINSISNLEKKFSIDDDAKSFLNKQIRFFCESGMLIIAN